MWDEDIDNPSSKSLNPHFQQQFHNAEYGPSSEASGHSEDSRKLRWGRSNFSQDEIQALESSSRQHDSTLTENNDIYSQPRDTPVFLTNKDMNKRMTYVADDLENVPNSEGKSFRYRYNFQTVANIVLLILPAVFFGTAAHFINGIMTDFKLFSASFSVFQGIFWPSFVFLVIDLIWWRKPMESSENNGGCVSLSCYNGKWKLVIMLLVHGTLAGIAVIMQLLSIQRLNISVSLALSFGPEVYVILLSFINRERRFSLELIICALLTYSGFIIIGFPAMTSRSYRMAEELTTGLVASLGSMTLAIPASFALVHLRKNQVPDSLTALSFAFHGSLFSWVTKMIMGSTMDLAFDPISFSWAAGLIALILCGTVLLFLGSRIRQVHSERDTTNVLNGNSSISQMRMLIFIFSCFWEIIRQGMWHTFPGIYDIFGSLLVVLGYLLAVGYEAWSLMESNEVKKESSPFQFISWLFSRTIVGNSSGSRFNYE